MTTINRLTKASTVVAGDLFPLYAGASGDDRAAAASVLLAYMQANLNFSPSDLYTTQYASPSATGFSVTVTDGVDDNTSVHLILTPLASYTTGTIVLPPVAKLTDKQEVLVNCTQGITVSLTIDKNGATGVVGAPTSLVANNFFRLKYDAVSKNWYRVG